MICYQLLDLFEAQEPLFFQKDLAQFEIHRPKAQHSSMSSLSLGSVKSKSNVQVYLSTGLGLWSLWVRYHIWGQEFCQSPL